MFFRCAIKLLNTIIRYDERKNERNEWTGNNMMNNAIQSNYSVRPPASHMLCIFRWNIFKIKTEIDRFGWRSWQNVQKKKFHFFCHTLRFLGCVWTVAKKQFNLSGSSDSNNNTKSKVSQRARIRHIFSLYFDHIFTSIRLFFSFIQFKSISNFEDDNSLNL